MAKVRLSIEVDAQGNVTAIDAAGVSLGKGEKAAAKMTAELARTKAAADRLSTSLMIGGAAVVGFGAYCAKLSSDLSEARNKSAVVFGPAAQKEIESWAQGSARAMGISRREAFETAGTFGNLFTAMGMGQEPAANLSKEMVELGSDLASFNNLKPEEALLKLRAGLVGEIEPLRTLGISFTAVEVANRAVKLGLAETTKEVSEAAKLQARYSLIMEQSKAAQGDFARTSEGLANSQRILRASVEDSMAAIGDGLRPALEQLLQAAVPIAETLGKIADSPAGERLTQIAVGAGALALALGGAYKAIMAVKAGGEALHIVLGWVTGRTAANTIAVDAETVALGRNTLAQDANALAAGRAGAARAGGAGAVGGGVAAGGGALGVAGRVGLGVVGVATGAGIGYTAGGVAARSKSTGAQAGLGAGSVLAAGAVGFAIGGPITAIIAGGMALAAGTYRMAAATDRMLTTYRQAQEKVGKQQDELAAMTSAQRKAYLAEFKASGAVVPGAATLPTSSFVMEEGQLGPTPAQWQAEKEMAVARGRGGARAGGTLARARQATRAPALRTYAQGPGKGSFQEAKVAWGQLEEMRVWQGQLARGEYERMAAKPSATVIEPKAVEVRVFIGDKELRQLSREETHKVLEQVMRP